jgi:phospholipid/cholesterol/gamma-HCH transport system substrate-binding protein
VIRRIAHSVGQIPSGMALGVAALLVVGAAGGASALGAGGHTTTITAHFDRTVGLYKESSVRILGVPVGTVTKIKAEGSTVAVTMKITKSGVHIPADAQAFIIPPALVSDRYVQIAPAYTSGPEMGDHGDIPLSRSHAPVEKDQIVASIDRLDLALGPQGANKDGALSRLIHVGAQNLTPDRATQIRQTVSDLADLVSTLDDNKDSLAGAVTQLDRFASLLLRDDSQIRQLYTDLAQVSAQLDGDRSALASALKNLSIATGEIASLVKSSRGDLRSDVSGILDLTNILVQDKDAVIESLDDVPLALTNLSTAFDPATNTLDTRANFGESVTSQGDETVCGALEDIGLPCSLISGVTGSTSAATPSGTTAPAGTSSPSTVTSTAAGLLGRVR